MSLNIFFNAFLITSYAVMILQHFSNGFFINIINQFLHNKFESFIIVYLEVFYTISKVKIKCFSLFLIFKRNQKKLIKTSIISKHVFFYNNNKKLNNFKICAESFSSPIKLNVFQILSIVFQQKQNFFKLHSIKISFNNV